MDSGPGSLQIVKMVFLNFLIIKQKDSILELPHYKSKNCEWLYLFPTETFLFSRGPIKTLLASCSHAENDIDQNSLYLC